MKKNKTMIILLIIAIAASLFAVTACKSGKEPTGGTVVSITNKSDLTAAWVEGEADRQLSVSITVDGAVATDKTYMVSSSNSDVVEVADDNKTLKATGGGTATITVKVDDVTDTVEITVTPSLKGVTIKNKTALRDVWTVGDAARLLEIEFNPDYYDANKPEYTVVSSAADVIEVGADKRTLTAKKLGEATIKVTAGEFSDSVTISVRPALESVTITNKADLTAAWIDWSAARTITLAYAPAEYYSEENTAPVITCEPADLVTVEGNVLTAVKDGALTVTVAVANKTDSFTVEIQRSAPKFRFEDTPGFTETAEGGNMGALENARVSLPAFSAKACDGTAIQNITVNAPAGVDYDENTKSLTAPKGTYDVTLTAVDPIDESKVTTKTISIIFARKIFGWQDGSWNVNKEYVADEGQTAITTMAGIQLASFNMEASKYYYAEVTFNGPARFVGLANFTVDSEGVQNKTRFLVGAVQPGDNNYQNIDYDVTLSANYDDADHSGWELIGNEWRDTLFNANYFFHSYRLSEYRGLAANEDTSIHKIAVIRMGDYFYTFWNDQYVNSITLRHYADYDSIPGLFTGFGDGNAAGSDAGVLTNITYFGGEAAVQAKYNALTDNGSKLVMAYVPDSWAEGSRNNGDKLTRKATTDGGLNFAYDGSAIVDDGNSSMISTYQMFDGDFSFSWTYKLTSANENASESRMALEARSYKYGNEQFVMGAQYGGKGGAHRWLLNTPQNSANQWCEDKHGFDTSLTLKYTLTRTLTDTYAEYVLKIEDVNDATNVFTRTIQVGADLDERWDKAVVLHWKNSGVSGEYTNVMWKNFNGNGNWVD